MSSFAATRCIFSTTHSSLRFFGSCAPTANYSSSSRPTKDPSSRRKWDGRFLKSSDFQIAGNDTGFTRPRDTLAEAYMYIGKRGMFTGLGMQPRRVLYWNEDFTQIEKFLTLSNSV